MATAGTSKNNGEVLSERTSIGKLRQVIELMKNSLMSLFAKEVSVKGQHIAVSFHDFSNNFDVLVRVGCDRSCQKQGQRMTWQLVRKYPH